MILSGIGGAAISLGSVPELVKGDVQLFLEADSVVWLGIAIRIVGGTLLGAFWGYLHCPESKPIKAFQIGLIAPAAIAGLVFTHIDKSSGDTGGPSTAVEEGIINGDLRLDAQPGLLSFVSTAHAAGLSDTIVIQPRSPSGTFLDRLVKGIIGK